MNFTEIEEKNYLSEVLTKLNRSLIRTSAEVNRHKEDVQENKTYLYENKDGMDHAEKINVRQSIDNIGLIGENAAAKRKRLFKLLQTPYFGRIDFRSKNEQHADVIYVGVHSFIDEDEKKSLIHDWRAPISSMFYDFELGKAWYVSPGGRTDGDILLRKQYRIRQGKMEYMFESSLNIQDDILQKELNQASGDKMKNIVATIQREQNAIIRNEESRTLIIQGVAGSGKTSIALHRIAFLLYRFKDTLNSEDILIISPNKVFANYISNVLPELGEEKVAETNMEELANQILMEKVKFQSFFDQVAEQLSRQDLSYIERVQYKSSPELIKKLDEYLLYLENDGFKAADILVHKYPVPGWFIAERFRAHNRLPLFSRHNEVVRDVVYNVLKHYKYEVSAVERSKVRTAVMKMFPTYNVKVLYKEFYTWLGMQQLFKSGKGSLYEYADIYPLIYLKIKLEGFKPFNKVRHLVIDEMQDYTPIQYKVLSRLFICNKTILGDINQSVNPFSSSSPQHIQSVVGDAECMTMHKSYRSTFEITNFTKRIAPELNIEAIERHGECPGIHGFKKAADETDFIKKEVELFTASGYNSLGIICKTYEQAKQLFDMLTVTRRPISLLDPGSAVFTGGIVVTTAHQAKGLEFDQVIVPFTSNINYLNTMDRQMLYVACSRAMHRLHLTFTGELTKLIQ